MSGTVISLARGNHRVEIDPDYGGRVTGFWSQVDTRRIDWLVPAPASGRDPLAPQKAGMFPLVPFSNRIENATFEFAGSARHIEATEAGKPHAIHGHGCRAGWHVASMSATSAMLVHQHSGKGWPSAYSVTQRFDLRDGDLVVHLIVDNIGKSAMPIGLGLHPFFPKRSGASLTARFENTWPAVADSIPAAAAPIPPGLDFSNGRALPDGLDTGFGGWDGRARIDWPGEGLGLEIGCTGPFGHAILFTPAGGDFLCVEPVTHAINAINLAASGVQGTGARVLDTGGRFGVSVSFRPILDSVHRGAE